MSDTAPDRPPYLAALGVALIVLAGYVASLAPTVTFWDAGEFIAAAKVLGIPHPPGTPLFVLMGHVWGMLVPVGEFAYRTNLLSAVFGAAAAGFFFLVVHESLRRWAAGLEPRLERLLTYGGALSAAILSAFAFTVWQNSNETEVYGIATFTIAAVCWLCFVWRARREDPRSSRLLLLILYLAGLSIGNHLLALLAGPAVVAFLAATVHGAPSRDPLQRRRDWAEVAVVAGAWALLIGMGLGSTALMVVGGLAFLAAAAFAATSGALSFALLAVVLASIGVTSYLFLYIRAGQSPPLNEADPSTWRSLLAVIRREQYPIRTPLDDPTIMHGPDNPGRSLQMIWLQLLNYFQYFSWQWARGLAEGLGTILVTTAMLFLGLWGWVLQRRTDRAGWWLLFMLWLVTGLGLVGYMNFKPGFSLAQGYELYPNPGDHEVRDRDYFFIASFAVWGLWAGMGLAAAARSAAARLSGAGLAAGAIFATALIPVVLNWQDASRRHGPAATLAADVAYNLLNTAPPYAVLFTYGDNDTFPLWWAQEVEGIRQDVTVVCIALANTDWYMRQLRDMPVRPFDEATAPEIWRGKGGPKPDWPVHTLTDDEIQAAMYAQLLPRDLTVRVGPVTTTLPANRIMGPSDIVMMRILQQNAGRRPIVWSVTAGREYLGMEPYLVQQGLGFQLHVSPPPDTLSPNLDRLGLAGSPLDLALTEQLAWETYRYADLLTADEGAVSNLESTSASFASTLSLPFTQLAYAYRERGMFDRVARNLERAVALSPNPALRAALDELRFPAALPLDTQSDSPAP